MEVEHLDACISPVEFTKGMVESENTGQVFMASKFVISCENDFDDARAFAKTIGTDEFASYWTGEAEGGSSQGLA